MVNQKVCVIFDNQKTDENANEIHTNHDLELSDCFKVNVVALPDCQT